MNRLRDAMLLGFTAVLLVAAPLPTAADEPCQGSTDVLVRVKAKKLDRLFLMPGADFRPYTKVVIDAARVAFQKDWMRNINSTQRDPSRWVTQQDADRIMEAARTGLAEVLTEALQKGGYEVVQAPGVDVLHLSPDITGLYVNAPDVMAPGRSRTYTLEAGEATLCLALRDSTTGTLLARVVDRRRTQPSQSLTPANAVTNDFAFRNMFTIWANSCVQGLDHLKELSPVPSELKPGQKLK